MSFSSLWSLIFPPWLREWLRFELIPRLGLQPQELLLGTLRGMWGTLWWMLVGLGLINGGRAYMDGQYALPRAIQSQVVKWAPVADSVARQTDIPREVPLVVWYKESSMQAENPRNCTGIMGTYDLVRSGQLPCFTPGPISDQEVAAQLAVGALEFKKRCPEVTYGTHDPAVLQRCYLAYNAGISAAQHIDPHTSAYVMNNFNEQYQNMVYRDVELGTVTVSALGAWPAHLAIQSMIAHQLDLEQPPLTLTLLDVGARLWDAGIYAVSNLLNMDLPTNPRMEFPADRDIGAQTCLGRAHILGRPSLRPTLNPVREDPLLTQDVHGCAYNLPGVDIASSNAASLLQAPILGEVTTYTDRWRNTTIRIENDEWIVWLLHARSYLVEEGTVEKGQAVGVMGAVGYATGPHVHYTVFDKITNRFVDPGLLLPKQIAESDGAETR